MLEVEISIQTIFGCIRKEGGPVIFDDDLQFKKNKLGSVNFPKKLENLFLMS